MTWKNALDLSAKTGSKTRWVNIMEKLIKSRKRLGLSVKAMWDRFKLNHHRIISKWLVYFEMSQINSITFRCADFMFSHRNNKLLSRTHYIICANDAIVHLFVLIIENFVIALMVTMPLCRILTKWTSLNTITENKYIVAINSINLILIEMKFNKTYPNRKTMFL